LHDYLRRRLSRSLHESTIVKCRWRLAQWSDTCEVLDRPTLKRWRRKKNQKLYNTSVSSLKLLWASVTASMTIVTRIFDFSNCRITYSFLKSSLICEYSWEYEFESCWLTNNHRLNFYRVNPMWQNLTFLIFFRSHDHLSLIVNRKLNIYSYRRALFCFFSCLVFLVDSIEASLFIHWICSLVDILQNTRHLLFSIFEHDIKSFIDLEEQNHKTFKNQNQNSELIKQNKS
jgi:hypothetical protein